jgi:ectoine hydroxylase-related dioxygenase (phytanoyl-CoA dioxygenase family)
MPLEPKLIEQYDEAGFLVMPDLLTESEIACLRQRVADIANGVVTTYPEASIEYEPGAPRERGLANVRKLNHCEHHDELLLDAARHPAILDVVESLIGPDIKLLGEQLFMKPPGGIEKAYHQDSPYFTIEPMSLVSAWIALDDVTEENGCLKVIAGSHRYGPRPHDEPWMVGDRRDMKIADADIDYGKETSILLKAGDVSFHHSLLMHSSGPNRTPYSRRGLAMHYMTAKSRWTGAPERKPSYMLLRGEEYAGCV